MHVQPERALEERLGDEEAVRRDDDGVDRDLDVVAEASRLRDRDPEALRHRFRGRGASLRPRPRGLSGRVRSSAMSWCSASRSSTSAPNGAVAATASRI